MGEIGVVEGTTPLEGLEVTRVVLGCKPGVSVVL